ncbi:MAG TPA: hypothetical protein VGJ97_06835 [Anaerolineaceae bacterium]|jgi:hypothetical protein
MDDKKANYWFQKKAQRKTGYPAATIAYYGPDDQFASKVVVGIVRSEQDKEATEVKKWFDVQQDVRSDATILREMLQYIEESQVHRVAMAPRIIGCPHEEGIDYPEGEECPQCLFWIHRDRWTGELLDREE